MRPDRIYRDPRRLSPREAINAGGDGRKRDLAKPLLAGYCEAGNIAVGQNLAFAGIAAAPNRADGVDHMPGSQPIAAGHSPLPRPTAAAGAAFGDELPARR